MSGTDRAAGAPASAPADLPRGARGDKPGDKPGDGTKGAEDARRQRLAAAAARARAEAEARRAAGPPGAAAGARPAEVDGPAGPEPTRYGDWERKGIASDF